MFWKKTPEEEPGKLHSEKAGKNEVGVKEQGSFDCAFPRWARECCAQDDSVK